MTKKRKKSQFGGPQHQPQVSVGRQPNTQEKRDDDKPSTSVTSDIHPTPNDVNKADHGRKTSVPWRKILKVLEGVGICADIGYAIISFCMWQAMLDANKFARDALQVSQRSYVTLGRKDGVIAEFKKSPSPKLGWHGHIFSEQRTSSSQIQLGVAKRGSRNRLLTHRCQ